MSDGHPLLKEKRDGAANELRRLHSQALAEKGAGAQPSSSQIFELKC